VSLAVLSLLALASATALLVRLHVVRTGLLPARDAVSDYGLYVTSIAWLAAAAVSLL
jgi:hypothetical protein